MQGPPELLAEVPVAGAHLPPRPFCCPPSCAISSVLGHLPTAQEECLQKKDNDEFCRRRENPREPVVLT